jgi:phosphoglycolate phosphatase
VRAYLFDLDGTLIDHFAAIHRCYAHTLGRMGLPEPTPAQVRAAVGGGIENSLAKFIPPARFAEAIAIYREFWDRTMLERVSLMPGAKELLEGLSGRGAALGVLTNKLGSSSRLICDKLGITPLVQVVLGAHDTPWLKPQPELTRLALERLGASADECLLVGDSPFDVDAAHAGGLPAWVVTTGTHTAEQLLAAGADRVFADLWRVGEELGLALAAS